MKDKIICLSLVIFGILLIFLVNFTNKRSHKDIDYIRIHIRADSDCENDQNVKYIVKEQIMDYLIPMIAECQNYQDVYNLINRELDNLKTISDNTLQNQGFEYRSNVLLTQEYFPARYYNGNLLENGTYDALIINLGEGVGDNWWCVVYPPLCFLSATQTDSDKIIYKSKIYELIKKATGKY